MENSLKTDGSFDRGIRRIFTALSEETKSIISPPHQDIHESIHNARKSFKFLRALLRLIKFPLGADLYGKENYTFRDMGRPMSDLRDAHVMPVILKYVALEAHSVSPSDIEAGFNELEERAHQVLDKAQNEERRFESIASELEACKTRVAGWPQIPDSLEALLPGVKEVYQKGREGFVAAQDDPSKEHFHEWRKQAKYLMHHYEILVNYWPDTLGINGKSLQQLSDYLGEEHDLALFYNLINEDLFRNKLNNVHALSSYVEQKRNFLQRSALNLGEFIYSKSDDDFITHFEEVESFKKNSD